MTTGGISNEAIVSQYPMTMTMAAKKSAGGGGGGGGGGGTSLACDFVFVTICSNIVTWLLYRSIEGEVLWLKPTLTNIGNWLAEMKVLAIDGNVTWRSLQYCYCIIIYSVANLVALLY